jgi:hypothetical protein
LFRGLSTGLAFYLTAKYLLRLLLSNNISKEVGLIAESLKLVLVLFSIYLFLDYLLGNSLLNFSAELIE